MGRRNWPVPVRDPSDVDWPLSAPLDWLWDIDHEDLFLHWQKPAAPSHTAACHGKHTTAAVTTSRWLVSCGACKQSRAWRAAA